MIFPLEGKFQTNQGAVRYGKLGAGPPVVLVHGTPWSSFSWYRIINGLSASHTVYFYDLIGYGQSEMREDQQVSLDVQGRVFAALLDHWELDDPVVIAHDFGGAVSLRAHLLHQADFERLVLMNVVAMAPWGSPFFAHVKEHEAAFSGVPAYIHKAILEAYIKGALYKDLPESDLAGLANPWLSNAAGQAAFYRQIAQASQIYTDEIEPHYKDIRCPVQILWGENDDWIPLGTGLRLHAAIPQSEFHPVASAGHLIQLDNPDAVSRHVRRFLNL